MPRVFVALCPCGIALTTKCMPALCPISVTAIGRGSSSSAALAVALCAKLTSCRVKAKTAVTGEVDLAGNMWPIGGVKVIRSVVLALYMAINALLTFTHLLSLDAASEL
jgi:hypothetical protein